jgi:hypothetical protein
MVDDHDRHPRFGRVGQLDPVTSFVDQDVPLLLGERAQGSLGLADRLRDLLGEPAGFPRRIGGDHCPGLHLDDGSDIADADDHITQFPHPAAARSHHGTEHEVGQPPVHRRLFGGRLGRQTDIAIR